MFTDDEEMNAENNDATLIGLLEGIRILNEKLQSPSELDKALARIQGAIAKAAENDESTNL